MVFALGTKGFIVLFSESALKIQTCVHHVATVHFGTQSFVGQINFQSLGTGFGSLGDLVLFPNSSEEWFLLLPGWEQPESSSV